MSMQESVNSVLAFHEKHGFPVEDGLFSKQQVDGPGSLGRQELMKGVAADIAEAAQKLELAFLVSGDQRLLRSHLILEEAGEVVEAMAEADEVKLLDGIADTIYVLFGTAVAAWPLAGELVSKAFNAVHESNMTKAVRNKGVNDPRLRTKGDTYVPPDLITVLSEHLEHADTVLAEVEQGT